MTDAVWCLNGGFGMHQIWSTSGEQRWNKRV